jgi:hypothetical protein
VLCLLCAESGPDIVSAEPEITVHEAVDGQISCASFQLGLMQVDWDADESRPERGTIHLNVKYIYSYFLNMLKHI